MQPTFHIASPSSSSQLHSLTEIFAKTFSAYWERVDYVLDGYIPHSNYDWNASRVGLIDGEVATHFGVWDFGMRIGSAVARVAGIGAVATLKTHRGHGLMAKTAGACVEGLGDAGYDMTLLFGIPNFYHRFGYVVTFTENQFLLSTRDLPAPSQDVVIEPFTGDVKVLAQVYNRENEGITGTYVRPTYGSNRRPGTDRIYTIPSGYVVVARDADTLEVVDCAGDPAEVVAAIRKLASAEVTPRIRFTFLPRRSRVGEYLQTVSHTFQAEHKPTGGPMIKIVNLHSLFEKLSGEMSRRLKASPLSGYDGSLVLEGDGETVVLEIAGGTVHKVRPGSSDAVDASGTVSAGAGLARLVLGDTEPARICRQEGITTTGDAVHLVPILFPDQEPSTILWDRF
ncbi:MAG: GNAT family N-acetyltransferase [Spirochaetales bacterium]|nr:MAG: GNAT family N-acetyltransferase [Spirochaetales bacterium]